MSLLYDSEMAAETIRRFSEIVPKVLGNLSLAITVYFNATTGVYVPIVFKRGETTDGRGRPTHYVEVRKVDADLFHVRFETMPILVGVGIPAAWWPVSVSTADLDQVILNVFETRENLENALASELVRWRTPEALQI